MYVPSTFRVDDIETIRGFMRQRPFATVVSSGASGMTASHLPLLLQGNDDGEETLVGHMARANGQWRDFSSGEEVLAMFQGAHGYISPSWYASEVAVPTWNYTAVHAYGVPEIVDAGPRLQSIVDAAVERFERGFNRPWTGGLPDSVREGLLKAIVGFEIRVTRLEGKFKLGQNRSLEDVEGACQALEASGSQADSELATLMRRAAEDSGNNPASRDP